MKKPIKTLFVFPANQVWGGEEVWLEFLARLDRNKISPFVLTFGKGKLLQRLEQIGVPYYLLPEVRIRNVFDLLRNLFLMMRFLRKERFGVVNSLGVHLLSSLSTSILNIPYILHIHTIHPLLFIDRRCIRKAKHIVTVSNFSKQFLCGYGVKPESIEVIHNGIDIEGLEKKTKGLDLRKELGLSVDAQIVCYAGRIVKWKNLDFLIKAIPKIKGGYCGNVKFLFVGDTPKRDLDEPDHKEVLLELAKELGVGDDIIFTGRREDVVDILKNIDIFAIPSLLEVCSMSILEAMAMGKPVVAVREGGNPELITNYTGILVEPGDLDGFADAIVGLLKDKERRQRMGRVGLLRVKEHFSIENNISKLTDIQRRQFLNFSILSAIIKDGFFHAAKKVKLKVLKKRGIRKTMRVEIEFPDGQLHTCWIKIIQAFPGEPSKDRESIVREYEVLKRIYEEFSYKEQLGAVKPIGFISDFAAIITENYPASKLRDIITTNCLLLNRKPVFTMGELEDILFNCGRWLAKFQKVTLPCKNLFKETSLLESKTVENDLASLAKIGVDEVLIKKLKEYFLINTPRIKSYDTQMVVCHPDFGPRNFMVGPRKEVVVLDFDNLDLRSYVEDAALFTVRLDLLLRHPLIDRARIERLKRSFLEGYQRVSGFSLDSNELRFWQVRYMVATSAGEYFFTQGRTFFLRYLIIKRTRDLLKKWMDEYVVV